MKRMTLKGGSGFLKPKTYKEVVEETKDIEMDCATFRKGLKRIRKERYQLAKNLSKR